MTRFGAVRDTFSLSGWLFADLLLALAMLFFAANTVGLPSPLPSVLGFDPTSGVVETAVRVSGHNLVDVRAVRIGNVKAPFRSISNTQLELTVPVDATGGPIGVTTDVGVGTSAGSFLVLVPTSTPPPSSTATPTPPSPTPTPTPTPSPTGVPTPSPTPTPCVSTVVLKKTPIIVDPRPDGGPPTDSQLLEKFDGFAGKRLGLLLTFGRTTRDNPEGGQKLASSLNNRLYELLGHLFTKDSITEAYHSFLPPYNSAEFNAYFFESSCR